MKKNIDESKILNEIDNATILLREMFILNKIKPKIGVVAMINLSINECIVQKKGKEEFMQYISDIWDFFNDGTIDEKKLMKKY